MDETKEDQGDLTLRTQTTLHKGTTTLQEEKTPPTATHQDSTDLQNDRILEDRTTAMETLSKDDRVLRNSQTANKKSSGRRTNTSITRSLGTS